VQDWLVAFHGEDVLPIAGQDLFDVAPVDVESAVTTTPDRSPGA
jgi:hypothetical protein